MKPNLLLTYFSLNFKSDKSIMASCIHAIAELSCGRQRTNIPTLVLVLLVCMLSVNLLSCATTHNNDDLSTQGPSDTQALYDTQSNATDDVVSSNTSDDVSDIESDEIPTYDDTQPKPRNSILEVLQGDGEFHSITSRKNGMYSQYLDLDHMIEDYFYDPEPGFILEITRFAAVDLDSDGIVEAVLDCTLEDGDGYTMWYEILHLCNEEVYGYTFVPREFYNLKADGTFEWEDGPSKGGFGKITAFYDTGDRIVDHFTYMDFYSDGGPYFINHNTVSEDEFNKELDRLRAMEDVEWHDYEGADFTAYFK